MKLCDICHKNVATIFTAKIENGKTETIGICLECAKNMGMPVIDQLMQQSGLSQDEIENISDQIGSIMEDVDLNQVDEMNENNPFLNFLTSNLPFGLKNKKEESNDNKEPRVKEEKEDKSKKKIFNKSRRNLNTYGTNLTDKAKNNEVDRVIGRQREIDRVIQILNRRNKNNPVLIGEPGVGKTAIAEGLAVRIAEGNVPSKLLNSEIYLLDLTAVVAGTQFRGQFEARMKSIIDEARECGNIILVIDELHNIIGAGDAQGGAMNAANILKPALARGEVQVIGATTLDEYRKYIEKDSALERRFQPVLVDEPTIEETIEILKGIRGYYEEYHGVKIPDDVIEAAVNLSERYITDRYLPDKAIDVIDEAGSRANLKNKGYVEFNALRDELTDIQTKMQEAADKADYERAALLKSDECKVKEKLNEMEKKLSEVTLKMDDVAYVIEAWTKIPVQRVTEKEAEKLLSLEERLHTRVIGQDEAIKSLSRAIRRNRSGFRKRKKPASFIFVGPTGVGKTELVRAIACELFGSEEALIRIDMSEYMEKHTVSKLIGAPPGYVGYDEGGQLTEKVRRKPYSVILLDEIEKAHSDVFNMLLQILEDGRLTDSQGRTVYFENTVIIMTSNAGTNFKAKGMGFANEGYRAMESYVKEALRETFRPEFLNRIDDVVVFDQLTRDELRKIVALMLNEVIDEAEEKGITLEVADDVKEFILDKGYDERYGARPLRRTIQRYIEDEIAEAYLSGKVKENSKVNILLKDGNVILS